MIAEVQKVFDQYLVETFKDNKAVMQFLLKHERKNICLQKLCEQITRAESSLYNIIFDVKLYQRTIKDVARMFAAQALRKSTEDNYSQAERNRIRSENEHIENAKEVMRELEKDGVVRKIVDDEKAG